MESNGTTGYMVFPTIATHHLLLIPEVFPGLELVLCLLRLQEWIAPAVAASQVLLDHHELQHQTEDAGGEERRDKELAEGLGLHPDRWLEAAAAATNTTLCVQLRKVGFQA